MSNLPNSIEAEKALLGAIFLDAEKIKAAKKYISAADFYMPKHAELFQAFEYCIAEGSAVLDNGTLDIVMLKDALEKRGTLEKVGGVSYLMELANSIVFMGNEEDYARQIRDRAERRRIIELCGVTAEACKNMDTAPSDVLDKLLGGITEKRQSGKSISSFSNALCDYFEHLRSRKNSGRRCPGLSTGFAKLDTALGGLEPAKLYIIGGRPGMGKTAFGLNVMETIAQNGKTVLLFSLEMDKNEVMKRVVSSVANINSYTLKTANCSESEIRKIPDILGKIGGSSIYICDDSYQTADSIYSRCLDVNAMLQGNGRQIDAVVIDYLQLISGSDKRKDRRTAIGEISRACKIMAKRLNCPVVLISQLSRANEARENKRPQLSDLRESGDIEQDADAVMLLYREEYYKPTPHNKGSAELIIAKNRDGVVGTVRLQWRPQTVKFEEELKN